MLDYFNVCLRNINIELLRMDQVMCDFIGLRTIYLTLSYLFQERLTVKLL